LHFKEFSFCSFLVGRLVERTLTLKADASVYFFPLGKARFSSRSARLAFRPSLL
jgi:hypothetical protein